MANRELQHQMSKLGLLDAGFAHGLATSLYMGDIMWNNWTTPSNLSPFTIFELDPLLLTQTARCLHLHLLSKNMEGKSLDKIKASQIQEIKAPGTFKELLQALQFYSGITTIFFGPPSACHWNKSNHRCHPIQEISLQNAHSHQQQVSHKVPVCHGNLHPTLAGLVSKILRLLNGQ
jgi:hypothetical protein